MEFDDCSKRNTRSEELKTLAAQNFLDSSLLTQGAHHSFYGRPRLGSSQAASMESSSLTGSLSLGSDVPHCQCCITYEARLKRLSCGHLYCDPCSDQIVNLAFEDIEGLAEYPCPMCKTLRHLGASFQPTATKEA